MIDDTRGNANGKLEPGEMVNLSLPLTNGWANATNISARISTTDPFVTIIKERANFPSVNHGGTVNNTADPFIILLDPACPQTHTINFTLDIAADGPYNYSRICLLTYAVAANQLAYDDGQADGYVGYEGKGGALAVRITPQSYPCYLTHIRLFPYEDCTITVKVWDNDGPRGLPGTVLCSVNADVKATGDWFDVDISSFGLKIDSGSFYVGWVEGDSIYYNGLDLDPPYYQRSWAYFPSYDMWVPFEGAGLLANLMVRVRECPIADAPVQNVTTGRKYFGIQAAINGARSGEQIVANKGTYYENIDFKGKNIVVRSTDPNDSAVVATTIIKGSDQAATFWTGEDANCVLAGFTITGGNIGICCAESAPTITKCVITKNAGEGIYTCYASPALANCTITGNEAGGVAADYMGEPVIRNCTITGNRGGGITVNWGTAKVTNSIIWGNWPAQIAHSYGTVLINYSDIQGGWPSQSHWGHLAVGNINADPCFVSAGYWANPNDPNIPADPNNANAIWIQGDYHLKSQGWRWNSQRREWDFDRITSRAIDAG
ncbi:MAG: right-handed parallel beta-helix repeat-containing protein, partial [Sedimentisphaerales bacterium]|nr:right-handed parallel beta-helix repeat-containing protein [Sedimentisphaerales bacterium]